MRRFCKKLNGRLGNPRDQVAALQEAMDFLRDALRRGPVGADELLRQARRAGVSEKTLRRAKSRLGVISARPAEGHPLHGQVGWFWELPAESGQAAPGARPARPQESLGLLPFGPGRRQADGSADGKWLRDCW